MLSDKGSVLDILYSGVLLFVFAICLLITMHIINKWGTEATAQGFNTEAQSIISSGKLAMTAWDYGFVFITIGMIISTIILAFMVGFHPVFFFLGVLEAILVFMLVPQFSNIYYNLATSEQLAEAAGTFTITQAIMDKLPLVLLGGLILVLIVMYTRLGAGVGT